MCHSCENGFAMKDNCKDRLDTNGSDDERLRGRVLDVPLECTLKRTSTLDEIHSSSNLQKLLEIQQAGGPKAKQVEAPRRKISDVIFSTWFFRRPDKTPRYEEDECIVFTALPASSTSSLTTDTEPPTERLSPSLSSLPVMSSSQDLEEDTSLVRERSRTISEGMKPSRPPDTRATQLATISITSIVKSQFSGFNVRELNVLAPQST